MRKGAGMGAKQWADEWVAAFNSHDPDRIGALDAEDVHFVAPGDVEVNGREAAQAYAMAWIDAFPDAKITVRNQVIADPYVVQEITFEGTHTGPLQSPTGEIPATGKRLTGRGVHVDRIENGVAVESALYYDQVQVMTQLGLMPEPATA